ncbi:DegT/DnrJ/EryC1/StrS family aminotransferase [Geitlerinema sp. CS-897]|nr:DegT/DnrJ/EryC1/StrS family aminotransferase [Geitlerinema sp. CS-897]
MHFQSSLPVQVPFNDLYAQYLSIREEIDEAIATVIRESAFIRGRFVEQFEAEFAQAVGARHCISCANGTDALYIAIKGLGLQPGEEVITTAHTWIATSETITQAGGRVVFCDTEPDLFTLDPNQIESKISDRTRGIIVVHLYGQPADMDAILAIARKHNLWVIEDCAQAHLATYKGKQVGTLGDIGTLSFYPGKNLGAMGDAGAIVTNSDRLAEWMALFARHGGKGTHRIEGINSRMDGLQAAILSVKLPHLPRWNQARRQVAQWYNELLSEVLEVTTPQVRPDVEHVYHLYVLQLDNRDRILAHLKDSGISAGIHYPIPLHEQPAYNYLRLTPDSLPVIHHAAHRILSLPIYPEVSQEQVFHVVETLKAFLKKNPHNT